jgi:cytoskeletal protein RodZ
MIFTPKQSRLLKGFSQNMIAEQLGIHVQTYRKLENDPSKFTVGQTKVFCEIVGIPYNQISF